MIEFDKYINKKVLIRSLGNKALKECVLKNIIPATESDEFVESLVIEIDDKERIVKSNELLQFFPKEDFEDESTEYYYVIFRYGKTDRSQEHIYMSHDYSIKPGDKVLVWQDWLYVGNVIRTGFFTKNAAPYPVENTWFIEDRVYDRIDFMKYEDSLQIMDEDNWYKHNYLHRDNDYRQFVGKVDYLYEWLRKEQVDFLTERKAHSAESIISNITYELDWDWCESNQVEVFYRTLIACVYMLQHNCYDKFYFDKYKCLSLIYKHGEFDEFMLNMDRDKMEIDKDVQYVDAYLG